MLRTILHKLAEEKEASVLEEDVVWQVLEYQLFEKEAWEDDAHGGGGVIEPMSTSDLWKTLLDLAKEMKLEREFQNRIKDVTRLGKHLSQIKDELSKRITVTQTPGKGGASMWGFRQKEEEADAIADKPVQETAYRDERLPEGITKPGEERPLQPEEEGQAVKEFSLDKLSDEDIEDTLKRLERLEKGNSGLERKN
jgi:hypothetical protein